jgi:hypothetical protein
VRLTAYIGNDDAIFIRARSEVTDDQKVRPLSESLDRVGPGEEFAGRTFKEWYQFLRHAAAMAFPKDLTPAKTVAF